MTLNQARKVISETRYTVVIQLGEGRFDYVRVDYYGGIDKHLENLEKLNAAKLAKVSDICYNKASEQIEIRCVLGE